MEKRKKLICSPIFLVIFLFASGMSGLGGDVPEKIPRPKKNFLVTVIDQADVRSQVKMFSINGSTFFTGRRGKGVFSIPFEKLSSIDFRFFEGNLEATAHLKEGQTVTLRIDKNVDCYGRTGFGTFRIKLGDIKRIIIEKQAQAAD